MAERVAAAPLRRWVYSSLHTALQVHGKDGQGWAALKAMALIYGYHGRVTNTELDELGGLTMREICDRGLVG